MKIENVRDFRSVVNIAGDRGDKVFLMERRGKEFQKITYAEMRHLVRSLSEFLFSLGINKGDKIGILATNRIEWGIAYLSIVYGGRTAVPLDPQLKEEEILNLMKIAEVKAVYTTERFFERVSGAGIPVITLDDTHPIRFSEAIEKGETLLKWNGEIKVEVNPDDIASIIFTSGTTGASKGVVLTHRNFLFDADMSERLLNLMEDDIFLSVLPIHHTFEFTGGFVDPLIRGNTICYARSLKSKELLEDLKDSRATMLLGVPLLFEKLYQGIMKKIGEAGGVKGLMLKYGINKGMRDARKKGNIPVRNFVTKKILEQAGLSTIRLMIAGGAALKPEVEEGIRALGIGIVQGYGLSEASPIVTINPPDRPNLGSIGLPIPETEVRIHNPDQDGIGELIVKGEHVMQGYYKNPDATAETIKDGWLHTGDLGYMDEDGYFYITGRKKAVIVTPGGKNVFPEELEYKLQQIDIVEEVLVIGVFDSEKKGDEIMAIIYPDWELLPECTGDDRTACAREKLEGLIKELNAELPPYKRIKYIEVREEEFPKTTTRKIKRYLFQNVKKI